MKIPGLNMLRKLDKDASLLYWSTLIIVHVKSNAEYAYDGLVKESTCQRGSHNETLVNLKLRPCSIKKQIARLRFELFP